MRRLHFVMNRSMLVLRSYIGRAFRFPSNGTPDAVADWSIRWLQAMQQQSEAAGLMRRVSELHPKVILEVGTAGGGSLVLLCQSAPLDATIITVCLPHHAGGYHWAKIPLYHSFTRGQQQLHRVRGNSHAAGTLTTVKNRLAGRNVDFLLIDGDHSYKGVKSDYDLYSPLVRSGGMIAFHDIRPHVRDDIKVDQFWRELAPRFRHEELIANPLSNGYGIGLLYV